MSIERAQQLKNELTDKWVVVATGVPELRRFQEFTGLVKTVNMNCRALVEFAGSEDISWYDIDPQFLTVVDAPKEEKKPGEGEKAKAAAAPAAKTASAKPATGGSPLDQIRAQTAGSPPAKETKAAGESPLDQIRAQAASGTTADSGPAKPATGGSPLDQIRARATAGAMPAAEEAPATAEKPNAETGPETTEPAPPPPPPAAPSVDTSGLSPLDIIRAQGAFKGDK